MRVLIVSDTHRKNESFMEVVAKESPLDLVIHCGDVEGAEYTIANAAGCESIIVMGNNDFFADLPREVETQIGNYKVMITHGHAYRVNAGNEMLKDEARARGMDIVMYGHTHRPVIDIEEGLVTINPGSLSYPRQDGRKPTYVMMELDASGKASFSLRYV